MKPFYYLFLLFSLLLPAHAAIEALQFVDKETEEDYMALIKELRCLVCQNQNLADSDAPLAKDLRSQTYDMLQQGKSRKDVMEYMVNRYGDFVLYRPPLQSNTALLWIGPFALLGLVLIIVLFRIKSTKTVEAPEVAEMDHAKRLLEDDAELTKKESAKGENK